MATMAQHETQLRLQRRKMALCFWNAPLRVTLFATAVAGCCLPLEAHASEDQSPSSPPRLIWRQPLAGEARLPLVISPDEHYAVALTDKELALLETQTGKLLWQQNFTTINRWMRKVEAVAVAPDARWLAIAGSTDYRYVWALDKQGRRKWHVPLKSTPQALAISNCGDRLAIGTAGGTISIVNDQGKLLQHVNFDNAIIEGLRFSEDDKKLITTRGWFQLGVLNSAGEVLWKRTGCILSLSASRDYQHFAVVDEINHSSDETLSLYSFNGKTVWTKKLSGSRAFILGDGSRTLVSGWSPQATDREHTEDDKPLFLLNQNGQKIVETKGDLEAVSKDERCFLARGRDGLTCRDATMKRIWRIGWNQERDETSCPSVYCTRDFSLVLLRHDGRVVAYRR